MRAFAFLGPAATDYLSGLRWPAPLAGAPGPWLDPGGSSPPVRACTVEQLPWWLDQELWAVELAGAIEDSGRALHAERGRLLERIDAWNAQTADELRWACTSRVRALAVAALRRDGREREGALLEQANGPEAIASVAKAAADGSGEASRLAGFTADAIGFAEDAADPVRAAGVVAYVAAHVVAGADESAPGYREAFAEERRTQAEWLRDRLRLSA